MKAIKNTFLLETKVMEPWKKVRYFSTFIANNKDETSQILHKQYFGVQKKTCMDTISAARVQIRAWNAWGVSPQTQQKVFTNHPLKPSFVFDKSLQLIIQRRYASSLKYNTLQHSPIKLLISQIKYYSNVYLHKRHIIHNNNNNNNTELFSILYVSEKNQKRDWQWLH